MAVGFTPKHIENFSLNDLTEEQFLVLAVDTAQKLAWKIGYLSKNGLVAYTDKGMFSWNAEITIKIENDVASIESASAGNEMVDWGKNKKNVNNFISNLEELKAASAKEELETKYQGLQPYFVPDEEDILKLPPATKLEQFKDFLSIFKPVPGYFITPILLNINILIFILMAISGANIMQPSSESLLNWGANFKPLTLGGQWWRILTSCFIHIGIFHLLMNMYALAYIGILLEPLLGKTRFITAYLLTGITASMTSLWWHDITISAGASGAIFGMYGVFLALLTTNFIEPSQRKSLLASVSVFVIYNLIFGLRGGVDNAAHIGGLVGGIIIGYALILSFIESDGNKWKYGTLGLLSVLILVSSFVVYTKLPNDIGIYDSKMQKFSSMESMALEVYNLPDSTSNEQLMHEIKDRGIYYWNENIKIIDSFKELNLPSSIETRNKLLKEYCQLRIKSYELIYKGVAENTNQYKRQIENNDKQIELKIKELEGK
ncbi:rhomboid family intramembrane serine protease [Emticicia fontis]